MQQKIFNTMEKNSDKTFSLEQFLSTIWATRLVNNSFLYKEYFA